MKIVDWSKKIKGKPRVGVVLGEDGDLYASYEGAVPLRIRDLITLWFDSVKQNGDVEKVSYLLNKADQKWLSKYRKRLEKMGYELLKQD